MQDSQEIRIPLNKSRMFELLLYSLLFVAGGLWFLFNPSKFGSPFLIFPLGIVTVVFFGYIGSSIAIKLFDTTPALVISDKGIMNNSSGFSKQVVTWPEITGFNISVVNNQRFLNVFVKNPRKYIKNEKGIIKKMMLRMNMRYYNTVIAIPLKTLKYNSEELLLLLTNRHAECTSKGGMEI